MDPVIENKLEQIENDIKSIENDLSQFSGDKNEEVYDSMNTKITTLMINVDDLGGGKEYRQRRMLLTKRLKELDDVLRERSKLAAPKGNQINAEFAEVWRKLIDVCGKILRHDDAKKINDELIVINEKVLKIDANHEEIIEERKLIARNEVIKCMCWLAKWEELVQFNDIVCRMYTLNYEIHLYACDDKWDADLEGNFMQRVSDFHREINREKDPELCQELYCVEVFLNDLIKRKIDEIVGEIEELEEIGEVKVEVDRREESIEVAVEEHDSVEPKIAIVDDEEDGCIEEFEEDELEEL